MDKREIKFIVGGISPFNKLGIKDIDKFLELGEVKEYRNGEIIYRELDPPDYFYLLLQGRVLALSTQEGREEELELLKRGTCFGLISLFTDDPHSVTTKSIESSFILRIEKEKFRKFLERHPLISLDFSRILSQRVKMKVKPKKIFQSKRIAVLGFPFCGKTTYIYDLAIILKKQTQKKVIYVETSADEKFTPPFLGKHTRSEERAGFSLPSLSGEKGEVLVLSEFKEKDLDKYILKADTDCLLVNFAPSRGGEKIDRAGMFVSLLNYLSESYHFIFYEVPSSALSKNLQEFVLGAHYLHFLLRSHKDELKKASSIIKRLKKKDPLSGEKLQVILYEHKGGDWLSFSEKRKILGHRIYATIPSLKDKDYQGSLRRIAREVGEVVLGLALGGGGAFSISGVGVLEVLEENEIYLDVISGTSVGSLVACLWAAGFGYREMEQILKDFARYVTSFSFAGFSFPFKGLLRAKRLEGFLKKVFKDKTFYDLKHSLQIPVFDFLKRESRILDEGPLYKAVAASCAYPGIFEPIRFKADILLDGGILEPLPTKVLFNYGADKIVAVNITPSKAEAVGDRKEKKKFHIFDFVFGSVETMQREFIQRAEKFADVVIHPNMEGLGWMEFGRVGEFIERGRLATKEKIPQIKKLVAS